MGWLYMPSLGQFETPKAYLEDQFTYETETKTNTIIASATVSSRTWYGACRQVDKWTGMVDVFAIVCLIHYNRRAKDGMIFGYKDMTEDMGPCESECPPAILNLLTATYNEYALQWRQRCRDHRQRVARAEPRIGDTIVFAKAISFSDGYLGNRFRFGKRGRQTVFTRHDAPGAYRISNWKVVEWTVIPTIDVTQLAA